MRVVGTEFAKIRGTWIWPLALLGPAGVIAAGVFDFAVRGDELVAHVAEAGGYFNLVMDQIGLLHALAFTMGAAIVGSMLIDLENRADTWKQLFGLPIPRPAHLAAKLIVFATVLLAASVLSATGVAGILLWQGAPALPWTDLGRLVLWPWAAGLGLMIVQLLLSWLWRSQAIPVTIGIAAAIAALIVTQGPARLVPWRLPFRALDGVMGAVNDTGAVVVLSAAWLVALAAVGAAHVVRRDIS
ncbi:MAG: ABC transporter permease [Anaerosomatales bacterium]|nr:ABC transporter permease [Anaerosomatales bacterium]